MSVQIVGGDTAKVQLQPATLAQKVAQASKRYPTATAFNNWHANNDVGVGSDSPWGSKR